MRSMPVQQLTNKRGIPQCLSKPESLQSLIRRNNASFTTVLFKVQSGMIGVQGKA